MPDHARTKLMILLLLLLWGIFGWLQIRWIAPQLRAFEFASEEEGDYSPLSFNEEPGGDEEELEQYKPRKEEIQESDTAPENSELNQLGGEATPVGEEAVDEGASLSSPVPTPTPFKSPNPVPTRSSSSEVISETPLPTVSPEMNHELKQSPSRQLTHPTPTVSSSETSRTKTLFRLVARLGFWPTNQEVVVSLDRTSELNPVKQSQPWLLYFSGVAGLFLTIFSLIILIKGWKESLP